MSVARIGSMRLDDRTPLVAGYGEMPELKMLNALMGRAPSGRPMLRSDHIA